MERKSLSDTTKWLHTLEIDITRYLCPMTFVRTRLALDRLDQGDILAVRLSGAEPRANVPKTAEEQGHQVLEMVDNADGTTLILIRKAGR